MLDRVSSKAGWTRVAFGDVVRKVNDKVDPWGSGLERYVAGEHMDTDDLRIRRWGLIGDDYLGPAFHMRFQPGQVLYGSRRTYLRKVALADFEGITANTTFVLETKDPARLTPELLPFIMQTEAFHSYSVKHSKGSVNPYINFSDLEAFEFLLPPIQEQARLVSLLKGAETTTEAFRGVVVTAKALRQSTIDHFSRISDRASVAFDEICEMQNGRPFPGDEYQSQGPRLLRPGNLGVNGNFKWNDGATVCLPARFEAEAAGYVVDAGDVVINLTAQSLEEGFMGRVCLAREGDRSLLNQRIGRFCDFTEGFQPEFIFRVLQSSRFQNHAMRMCEGSKIKHLFWQHLAPFLVPKLDAAEQATVIETIRAIDTQIEESQSRMSSAMLDRARLYDLTRTDEASA